MSTGKPYAEVPLSDEELELTVKSGQAFTDSVCDSVELFMSTLVDHGMDSQKAASLAAHALLVTAVKSLLVGCGFDDSDFNKNEVLAIVDSAFEKMVKATAYAALMKIQNDKSKYN